MWYGGKQVIEGHLSPGDLFAFVLFAGILIVPFGSVARIYSQVKEVQGAMTRVFELLDTPLDIQDTPDSQPLVPIRGDVQFEEVQFAYEERPPVLDSVSPFPLRLENVSRLWVRLELGKPRLLTSFTVFMIPRRGECSLMATTQDPFNWIVCMGNWPWFLKKHSCLVAPLWTIFDTVAGKLLKAEVLEASQRANAHDFIHCSSGRV